MIEKLDLYDILGTLVPGTLLICFIPICFPTIVEAFPRIPFPDAIRVLALVVLAFFIGQLIQAVGSLLEKGLFWTWGCVPSEKALAEGLGNRYLPHDSAVRIRDKLSHVVGSTATTRSLFLFAMQVAESADKSRVSRFNSLYAYHRGLSVMGLASLLLTIASVCYGSASAWPAGLQAGTLLGVAVLCILIWHRTKQRAFYYVREVLFTAERLLDERLRKESAAQGEQEKTR